MGFIKKAAVATAMATAVVAMVGQGGAFGAAAGAAVGTGTIAPGLTTTPTPQTSVTFGGSVVYASTNGSTAVLAPVSFNGASVGNETVQQGQGGGNLSGALAGPVTYARTGNLVTLNGTINGGAILAGACIFVPTSVNPTVSYALLCAAATS